MPKRTPFKSSAKERAEMRLMQALAATRRLRRRMEQVPDGETKEFYAACLRDVSTAIETAN